MVCGTRKPVKDRLWGELVSSYFDFSARPRTSFSITSTHRTREISISSAFSMRGIKVSCFSSAWLWGNGCTSDLCGRLSNDHDPRCTNQAKISCNQAFTCCFLVNSMDVSSLVLWCPGLQDTDHAQSLSIHPYGVCQIINNAVDDILSTEELGVDIVYIPVYESAQPWHILGPVSCSLTFWR